MGLAALQFLGGFLAALWESGTQYAAPPHALPVASWGLACAAMDAFEDASDFFASGAGRGRTLFSSSRGGASASSRERGDGSRETAPHELFLAGSARRRRVAALAQATHCFALAFALALDAVAIGRMDEVLASRASPSRFDANRRAARAGTWIALVAKVLAAPFAWALAARAIARLRAAEEAKARGGDERV